MKRKLIFVTAISLFSFLLISGLYFSSAKPLPHANNFIRTFQPYSLELDKVIDIQHNSYYIAGITGSSVYLGNETAPSFVLTVDSAFTDTSHLRISNIGSEKIHSGRLLIDSPYFYLINHANRNILQGSLRRWVAERSMSSKAFADAWVPIGINSFAIRTFKPNAREYTLSKEIINTSYSKTSFNLLEKQVDGIFCTDGMLNFDSHRSLLVYVYFYRNQFICIDTNLNVLYRGRTIDTTSIAKIKVANLKSGKVSTLSGRPPIVNRRSCVFNGNLFINSTLKADNEKQGMFNHMNVIDVYDLQNGDYKSSFYVPYYKNRKIKQFRVFNNSLIAISDRFLLIYKLDKRI